MTDNSFDPVNSLSTLRDNLKNRLNQAVDTGIRSIAQYPLMDVYKTDDAVVVQTEPLDGLDTDSIEVVITDNQLTISGTTKCPANDIAIDDYLRRERVYGDFTRTITIPVAVKPEVAKAKYKAKILTVILPLKITDDAEVIGVQIAD